VGKARYLRPVRDGHADAADHHGAEEYHATRTRRRKVLARIAPGLIRVGHCKVSERGSPAQFPIKTKAPAGGHRGQEPPESARGA
jgi:hypothetical protein